MNLDILADKIIEELSFVKLSDSGSSIVVKKANNKEELKSNVT